MRVFGNFRQNIFPVVISEDATAASVHLDVVKRGEEYLVYGLSGGVHAVTSVDDLITLINKHGFAKSFYEYMAVSAAPSGLYLPLQVLSTDNTAKTLNHEAITQQWKRMDETLAACNGQPIAHVGDGASVFRYGQVFGKISREESRMALVIPYCRVTFMMMRAPRLVSMSGYDNPLQRCQKWKTMQESGPGECPMPEVTDAASWD